MKKLLFILFLIILVSCGSLRKSAGKSYDRRVTVSSMTTLYDDKFNPTFYFTLKNNTTKTIATFDATLVIYRIDKETRVVNSEFKESVRWQTSLAPGQTSNYHYKGKYSYTWDYVYSCKSVHINTIRYTDGTISY